MDTSLGGDWGGGGFLKDFHEQSPDIIHQHMLENMVIGLAIEQTVLSY